MTDSKHFARKPVGGDKSNPSDQTTPQQSENSSHRDFAAQTQQMRDTPSSSTYGERHTVRQDSSDVTTAATRMLRGLRISPSLSHEHTQSDGDDPTAEISPMAEHGTPTRSTFPESPFHDNTELERSETVMSADVTSRNVISTIDNVPTGYGGTERYLSDNLFNPPEHVLHTTPTDDLSRQSEQSAFTPYGYDLYDEERIGSGFTEQNPQIDRGKGVAQTPGMETSSSLYNRQTEAPYSNVDVHDIQPFTSSDISTVRTDEHTEEPGSFAIDMSEPYIPSSSARKDAPTSSGNDSTLQQQSEVSLNRSDTVLPGYEEAAQIRDKLKQQQRTDTSSSTDSKLDSQEALDTFSSELFNRELALKRSESSSIERLREYKSIIEDYTRLEKAFQRFNKKPSFFRSRKGNSAVSTSIEATIRRKPQVIKAFENEVRKYTEDMAKLASSIVKQEATRKNNLSTRFEKVRALKNIFDNHRKLYQSIGELESTGALEMLPKDDPSHTFFGAAKSKSTDTTQMHTDLTIEVFGLKTEIANEFAGKGAEEATKANEIRQRFNEMSTNVQLEHLPHLLSEIRQIDQLIASHEHRRGEVTWLQTHFGGNLQVDEHLYHIALGDQQLRNQRDAMRNKLSEQSRKLAEKLKGSSSSVLETMLRINKQVANMQSQITHDQDPRPGESTKKSLTELLGEHDTIGANIDFIDNWNRSSLMNDEQMNQVISDLHSFHAHVNERVLDYISKINDNASSVLDYMHQRYESQTGNQIKAQLENLGWHYHPEGDYTLSRLYDFYKQNQSIRQTYKAEYRPLREAGKWFRKLLPEQSEEKLTFLRDESRMEDIHSSLVDAFPDKIRKTAEEIQEKETDIEKHKELGTITAEDLQQRASIIEEYTLISSVLTDCREIIGPDKISPDYAITVAKELERQRQQLRADTIEALRIIGGKIETPSTFLKQTSALKDQITNRGITATSTQEYLNLWSMYVNHRQANKLLLTIPNDSTDPDIKDRRLYVEQRMRNFDETEMRQKLSEVYKLLYG